MSRQQATAFALAATFTLAASARAVAAPSFSMSDALSAPFVFDLVASPDGPGVAFVAHEGGRRNVYYWDGTRTRAITAYSSDDGEALTELHFVPRRRAVVFVRGGTGDEGRGHTPNPALRTVPPKRTVWLAPLDGGPAERIGTGQSPAVSPAGDRIAWADGETLYAAMLQAGATEPPRVRKATSVLTSVGTLDDLAFSPDGTRIAFTDERRDHSLVGNVHFGDERIAYADASFAFDSAPAWSPDGRRIAFVRMGVGGALDPYLPDDVANAPWSVVVADAASGTTRAAFTAPPGRGAAFYPLDGPQQVFWSRDGSSLVFPWERDGWRHLYSVSSAGGTPVLLTPGAFEVETAAPAFDRSALLVASNEADIDRRHVWRVTLDGAPAMQLTTGTNSQWSPVGLSDGRVAYVAASYADPPAVFVAGRNAAAAVGGPDVPASFPRAAFARPQLVTFRAADGLTIHGQLFLPPGKEAGKRPALLFTHGGPVRQMLPGFHYFEPYTNLYESNQYFANHGFVVLSINYRSGIMYGHDFREAKDTAYLGASEYQDVLAGAGFLLARPDVDPRRLGLYGLSFGGYLTALGLARNSNIFKAGADYAGVHDFAAWIDAGSGRTVGTVSQRATALAASPIGALDRWRSPVFLEQGDDDRNVPFAQGLDLARRLEERGVTVEEMVLPNETHEPQVHANIVKLYSAAAAFLEHMLGASPP